jgi:hypothetical protein
VKLGLAIALTATLGALVGCTGDIDPAWQLDHDRVISVRATPPRIASGEAAVLDTLLGHKGAPPDTGEPDAAEVVSPSGLDSALSHEPAGWTVTAPPDDQLAPARAELGLAATDPVPLRVKLTFAEPFGVAYKIVWLGEHAENPVIAPITIDGMDALAEAQLSVTAATDIRVSVDLDTTYDINWLTSCGTMHDFDLASAYLRVEPEDPHDGTFALVVRDAQGGVAWHLWPISAP